MATVSRVVQRFWLAVSRKKGLSINSMQASSLERKLNIIHLTIIGVAATLSVSIYILLGQAARNMAGPAVIISLTIDALAAFMSGFCYAELAARIPIAGSAYTYTNATMGEALAFLVGWNLLFEYAIGTALFARGFTGYLNSILHGQLNELLRSINTEVRFLDFETRLDVTAALLCILLTVIMVFGWEPTNIVITVTVIGSTSIILMIVVLGLVYGSMSNWVPFLPYGVIGVIKGASACFYAFVGYDVIAMSAEETVNPRVTIPLAIITTIGICFFFFVTVAVALTMLVPYNLLTVDATLVTAFQRHGLYFFGYIVFISMSLGAVGGITATLIPLPRLVYAMSKDGLLFGILGHVSSRNMPVNASIVTGILTAAVALCFDTGNLVKMTSMGTLVAYSSVSLCVILLRYRVSHVNVILPDEKDDSLRSDVVETENLEKDPKGSNDENKNSFHIEEGEKEKESEADEMKGDNMKNMEPATNKITGFEGNPQDLFTIERHPTEKSELIVNLGCFCLVVQLTAICSIIVYAFDKIFLYDMPVIIGLCILAASTIFTLLLISVQPENKAALFFRVPVVPWLPALSLFINIYLIMLLDRGSWIRFGIWLSLGFIVYFGYGIRHSKAESHMQCEYSRLN